MHLGIITPSIISLDLPERKLPLSHGGLNGANKTRATDNLNTTLPQLFLFFISTHFTNAINNFIITKPLQYTSSCIYLNINPLKVLSSWTYLRGSFL